MYWVLLVREPEGLLTGFGRNNIATLYTNVNGQVSSAKHREP
jgi:hypothetical protein